MTSGWVARTHSKKQFDRALQAAVDPQTAPVDRAQAITIINNWRSSHSFPLNTFQMGLRNRVRDIDADATIAQRLKRLPSILAKARRFPNMKLTQVQDIGGCRAVVPTVVDVRALKAKYMEGYGKHLLASEDDYIDDEPKRSGYRGVHLVFKYRSDRNETYNGLRIEIQIRTRLQHAWATAVETVGFFSNQALKASQGKDEWLRFFALMAAEIAEIEGTKTVPGTPATRVERISELRDLAYELGVVERLDFYREALHLDEEINVGSAKGQYILELDTESPQLTVRHVAKLAEAQEVYARLEAEAETRPGLDVVLVEVDSMVALRRAYPNYFMDTDDFARLVEVTLAD